MKVEALLCDAATVREGLLHILGAGITRIHRPSEPSVMGAQLALLMTLQPVEAKENHRIKVVIQDIDGQQVTEFSAEFGVGKGTGPHKPTDPVALPMVLDISQVRIPKFGDYSLEVLVDSQLVKSLPFSMMKIMVGPGPPRA